MVRTITTTVYFVYIERRLKYTPKGSVLNTMAATKRPNAKKAKANTAVDRVIKLNLGAVSIPPHVMPLFSDGLIIQYAQEAFVLSFLKVMNPLTEQLAKASPLESRCIAQIVVTPSQMAEHLKALVSHFIGFASAQDPEVKEYLLNKANLQDPTDSEVKK